MCSLEEPFKHKGNVRTAIGCSVLYATQVFKATQGGPAKPLRANNTHATVFRIRDPSTFDDVATDMGSFVGRARFVQAYKLATAVDHDSLTTTFKPQRPEFQFRRGLGELIIIPDKSSAVQKDGIVFEDHDFEMDACFRRKDGAFHNCNTCEAYVYGVYPSDFWAIPPPPSQEIVDSPITLAVGGGGCGKTTHYLKDAGLISPIFIAPSWKLAR